MGCGFSGLEGLRRGEPGSDAVLAGFHALVPVSYAVVLVSHMVVHVEHTVVHAEHAVVLVKHTLVRVELTLVPVRSCKHRKPRFRHENRDGHPTPFPPPGRAHGAHGRVR